MNFTALAFVDTFALAASLPTRMGSFGPGDGLRQIVVRGPRAGAEPDDDLAYVVFKRAYWPEMKATIEHIKRLAASLDGGIEFGRIVLELIPAGVRLPWVDDDSAYNHRFVRSHLALRTNPGVITYSGAESMNLPAGMLVLVNHRAPTATCNFGETAMIRLVVDTRKKDASE